MICSQGGIIDPASHKRMTKMCGIWCGNVFCHINLPHILVVIFSLKFRWDFVEHFVAIAIISHTLDEISTNFLCGKIVWQWPLPQAKKAKNTWFQRNFGCGNGPLPHPFATKKIVGISLKFRSMSDYNNCLATKSSTKSQRNSNETFLVAKRVATCGQRNPNEISTIRF